MACIQQEIKIGSFDGINNGVFQQNEIISGGCVFVKTIECCNKCIFRHKERCYFGTIGSITENADKSLFNKKKSAAACTLLNKKMPFG